MTDKAANALPFGAFHGIGVSFNQQMSRSNRIFWKSA
jgi:hypothetical protein